MNHEWNADRYNDQKQRCQKLTSKGLLIALNQEAGMYAEVAEAYRDTLRERGIDADYARARAMEAEGA